MSPTPARRRRLTALAVALTGVALTQQACSASSDPTSSTSVPAAATSGGPQAPAGTVPSTAASPSAAATGTASPDASASASSTPSGTGSGGSASAIFAGKRQVWLLPDKSEAALGVATSGKVELSESFGERDLFVLDPISPGSAKVSIKTGKIRKGGEPLCLAIKTNGSRALTLVAAACDAGKTAQTFTFQKAGKNGSGKPLYHIAGAGGPYVWASDKQGVIAEEIGDGPAATGFLLVDKGPSTLPNFG